jgi:thioredoxin-related protein
MKKITGIIAVTAIAAFAIMAFRPAAEITPLGIGAAIPMADKPMNDVVSGKEVTLNASKGEMGTLVIFSCNTCPYVIANESRIAESLAMATSMKFGAIIINSNEALREKEDSPEAMKQYATAQKYGCSYVVDVNSELADAFGASRTPECFLFDKAGKLVYHGAIDDSPKEAKSVKERYLSTALTAVSKGEAVPTATSVSVGCTIKRKLQ